MSLNNYNARFLLIHFSFNLSFERQISTQFDFESAFSFCCMAVWDDCWSPMARESLPGWSSILRRLSRSHRPKLLYDGRHPPRVRWPVASGVRISWQGGKWAGQLGLGVSSSCPAVQNVRYIRNFSFTVLFILPATQYSNWVANVLALFILASVIWNQIFSSNPLLFCNFSPFQLYLYALTGVYPLKYGNRWNVHEALRGS